MAKRLISKKRQLKMMLDETMRQLTIAPRFDLRRTEPPRYDRRRSACDTRPND